MKEQSSEASQQVRVVQRVSCSPAPSAAWCKKPCGLHRPPTPDTGPLKINLKTNEVLVVDQNEWI